MKKILFASAATLAMTAGVASAQNITFSGDARMGVVYANTGGLVSGTAGFAPLGATTAKAQFAARARMTITMKRTTDSGMEVGATFRADNAGAAAANMMTDGSVYISGDFGKLTMGNISGAVEGAVGGLPNIGYSELRQNVQWLSNAGGNRTSARYEYSFDGFTVMVSSDQLTRGAGAGYAALGMKYTFDGITLSLGHEQGKNAGGVNDRHTMIGAEAKIDMVTLKAVYGERKTTGLPKTKQYGVSAQGTFDATTVTAYYVNRLDDTRNFGIGASYNLGGGAALVGGINRSSIKGTPTVAANSKSRTTADFGVTMRF